MKSVLTQQKKKFETKDSISFIFLFHVFFLLLLLVHNIKILRKHFYC